jgi:glyoxylase-like metal-dependent hydrolase (beta-lactamase superfamily II)
MTFQYGVLEQVAPGLRRIVCRNPGLLTFKGTNLYVIGEGEVAVADPGPAEAGQLDVLMDALGGERITHILLTHCHADHSGAAGALRERTGALTCGMPRLARHRARKGSFGTIIVLWITISQAARRQARRAGLRNQAVATPGHAGPFVSIFGH